jgi:hypothetical protein
VFNGYTEGALKFKPTYKYDVGSSSYDTSHKVLLYWYHVPDANNFADMSQYISKIYCSSVLCFFSSLLQIRVPSWTDRILFKVNHSSGLDAILSSYESLDCVISSDHKPVKAHLCLKVRNADD